MAVAGGYIRSRSAGEDIVRSASMAKMQNQAETTWSPVTGVTGGNRVADDFAFGSDLVTFRAILRGDGTLVDRTGAIKMYQGAAT